MKKMRCRGYIFCLLLFLSAANQLSAQNRYKEVRKGNRLYKSSLYEQAAEYYGKSLAKDSTYSKADYNMGNALYKQKRYDEALRYYTKAVQDGDAKIKQDALYNNGNSYLKKAIDDMQKGSQSDALGKAVESYIDVLKTNPNHQNAKYNLAYALRLQNQTEQNQQDENKDQQGGGQNQQDENKDQQKEKESQTRKADAERMLEALKSNEKKVMERQKVKIKGAQVEKDW